MYKKKKLAKNSKEASAQILEIKAILTALSDLEQSDYPANILIDMATKKIKKVFYYLEKNRQMMNLID